MIKQFLSLERKQYFRSSYWQKSMALNLLLGFFALWVVGFFLVMGFALFPAIKELIPESDPFLVVNSYLFYWVLADLMLRFFLQKLPVMSVKPLLTLPVKKSSIVNYVLGKSAVSFFNFLPLFAIVPFSIQLINNDYDGSIIFFWAATLVLFSFINNFLNFIIESFSTKTELSFLPIIVFSGLLYGLNYFEIISFGQLLSKGTLAIAENPLLMLIPILILIALYLFNYKILRAKLFIDSSLKTKIKEVKTADLKWTHAFGDVSTFIQLDLKLIWRNKRSRSSVFILIIGLLYGLFFYPQQQYQDMPIFFIFIGIFVTGIFLINFGQFIPAWDSSYYKMLMSQNIKYEQYLKSKFTLMIISVVILFVLSIPYVYFGWKILLAHFAAAIYNLGVNSHVILYGGSFNRKKINLDQRAAFNYQGTGAVQWLIGFPLMLFPVLIFLPFYYLINFEAGIVALIILGLLGIILHQKIMKGITKRYLASKYKMINAFSQEN